MEKYTPAVPNKDSKEFNALIYHESSPVSFQNPIPGFPPPSISSATRIRRPERNVASASYTLNPFTPISIRAPLVAVCTSAPVIVLDPVIFEA